MEKEVKIDQAQLEQVIAFLKKLQIPVVTKAPVKTSRRTLPAKILGIAESLLKRHWQFLIADIVKELADVPDSCFGKGTRESVVSSQLGRCPKFKRQRNMGDIRIMRA